MLIKVKSFNAEIRVDSDGSLVIKVEGPPGDSQAVVEVYDLDRYDRTIMERTAPVARSDLVIFNGKPFLDQGSHLG